MDYSLTATAELARSAVASADTSRALRDGRAAAASTETAAARDALLREKAEEFEAVFVAEMLKLTDLADASGPFSGGHGEETFRSFLLTEYATALTEKQSFGLADQIYSSLKARETPETTTPEAADVE